MQRLTRAAGLVLAFAGALAAAAPAASADETPGACVPIVVAVCPSIALGEYAPTFNSPSFGAVLSASVPHIPIAYVPQIAVAIPFRGPGRYAVTGELQTYGALNMGIGAGIGNLDGVGQSGFVFDVLGGIRIVPNVSLVGRYYVGLRSGAGNSGFIGLRFGF